MELRSAFGRSSLRLRVGPAGAGLPAVANVDPTLRRPSDVAWVRTRRLEPMIRPRPTFFPSSGRGGMELRSAFGRSSLRLRVRQASAGSASCRKRRPHVAPSFGRRVGSNASARTDDPTETHLRSFERTGWDSNPRGRLPTRFPIVRLKPLGHPSRSKRPRTGSAHDPRSASRPLDTKLRAPPKSGMELRSAFGRSSLRLRVGRAGAGHPAVANVDPTLRRPADGAWVRTHLLPEATRHLTPRFESRGRRFQTEGVGFEPTRTFRSNALAGRRLKPLGHPSKAETLRMKEASPELPR
jgi:hypothetical protein